MYEYKVEVDRVVDGDTVDLFVDLGFSIKLKERFRLFGINAPESRTRDLEEKKRGLAATEFLKTLVHGADSLTVVTSKDSKGKYGRFLGTLYLNRGEPEEMNINDEMVVLGHAIYQEY